MKIDKASVLHSLDQLLSLNRLKRHVTPSEFNTRALSAIERIAGPDSVYAKQARGYIEKHRLDYGPTEDTLNGIVRALRSDVANGYLTTLQELIHADVFADYLEMAEYLQSEGYKDAAAVLAGGTLEGHLRQLCRKHNIPIEVQTPTRLEPKKAERMNTDLRDGQVYSLLEQKQITAWLDLRNKAAHGKYTEYTKEQVAHFLQGLRDFILKYPA